MSSQSLPPILHSVPRLGAILFQAGHLRSHGGMKRWFNASTTADVPEGILTWIFQQARRNREPLEANGHKFRPRDLGHKKNMAGSVFLTICFSARQHARTARSRSTVCERPSWSYAVRPGILNLCVSILFIRVFVSLMFKSSMICSCSIHFLPTAQVTWDDGDCRIRHAKPGESQKNGIRKS